MNSTHARTFWDRASNFKPAGAVWLLETKSWCFITTIMKQVTKTLPRHFWSVSIEIEQTDNLTTRLSTTQALNEGVEHVDYCERRQRCCNWRHFIFFNWPWACNLATARTLKPCISSAWNFRPDLAPQLPWSSLLAQMTACAWDSALCYHESVDCCGLNMELSNKAFEDSAMDGISWLIFMLATVKSHILMQTD